MQEGTSGYIIYTATVLTLVLPSGGGNIVKMRAKLAEVATMHFVLHNGLPVIVASEVRTVLRRAKINNPVSRGVIPVHDS